MVTQNFVSNLVLCHGSWSHKTLLTCYDVISYGHTKLGDRLYIILSKVNYLCLVLFICSACLANLCHKYVDLH